MRRLRHDLNHLVSAGRCCSSPAARHAPGACAVGAFLDDPINRMLGVDGTTEAAVYMLALGHTSSG